MSDFPGTVVDDDGNVHHLIREPLGRGGQGVVFRTRSPHIAVKLIGAVAEPATVAAAPRAVHLWNRLSHAAGIDLTVDEAKHTALRERLEDVRALPLPRLHLAEPLSTLRHHVGYTMRLLTGMVPMRSLIAEPGAQRLAERYLETGGVGRRLELLARTASLLARLHAIPLVYADVSPNNIFISETLDAHEVWLIDLDNLDYLSSHAPGIYTPGFGAPEVITGRAGVSTLSDAFAFAVLAFWVLTQTHPFLGDYVEEASWDDDDDDREQRALRGDVAWIEDPDDASNRTGKGIPRDFVLAPPVRTLFARCFGAGRHDRTARPSLAEWADVLRSAADRAVACKACASSFDVTRGRCPFCSAGLVPTFIHLQVSRWDPELTPALGAHPVWHQMLDATKDSVIRRHVVEPVLADSDDEPVLRVKILKSGLAIEPLANREIHVVIGGRVQRLDREKALPMPRPGAEVILHFGPLDQPHRVAVLRLVEPA
jgi:serine/threonine protein kinase